MKKLANHIILSGVTVSMLFSPLMALPSGGKFTHGTSGTININGNNMDIMGKGQNSVIQWGGGFNIGKGESVNFGGSNKNYLNIAHGTSKSTIEGILNAGGNNVFLINPNGVIITKTGTINANRFVASTSSMSDDDMWKFAKSTQAQGAAFSPVFKPQKAGNVVNMGNINANDVLLIGNKVDIQGGKVGNKNSTTHLVGNDLVLNPSSFAGNKTNYLTALKSVSIAASMSAFEDGGYKFVGADGFTLANYIDNNNKVTENKVQKIDFKQYLTIDSVGEWAIFADAWNNNRGDTRDVKEFRLIDDIDFKNDFKPEYMVGYTSYSSWDGAFTSTFNGNGYTLSNIKMDLDQLKISDPRYRVIGIFGAVDGGSIRNLKVNNVDFKVNVNGQSNAINIGGLVGKTQNSKFEDIELSNIKLSGNYFQNAGGFAGLSKQDGEYSRIKINGVYAEALYGVNSGGFIGTIDGGKFYDISVYGGKDKGYGIINGASGAGGGFIGYIDQNTNTNSDFKNIKISDFELIRGGKTYGAGGFIGYANLWNGINLNFENITIENIDKIESSKAAAGFSSYIDANVNAKNITIKNIGEIYSMSGSVAGFANQILSANSSIHNFENIMIDGIGNFNLGFQSKGVSAAFANTISNGTYKNISINNIKKVTFDDFNSGDFSLFAGDAGDAFKPNDKTVFENITIHGVENIQGRNGKIFSFARDLNGNIELNNVYIFLDGNYQGKEQYLFANAKYGLNEKVNFNNVNVYLKNGVFDRIKDNEATYQGKITFVKFDENELASKKQDFITSAQATTGIQYDQASNSFKTTTDFKVTDPKFSTIGEGGEGGEGSDAKLDEDDLLQEIIKEEIINDITNGKYKLQISDLLKMLEDKANYSTMSEDQKVEFVVKYFLSGDKTKALEVVQSLDFLLAYEKNGLNTASKDKFEGNGFSVKNEILSQVNNTTKTIKDKIDKLEKDLKPLVNTSNGYLKDLIAMQNKLDNAIKAYNAYVDLINKGLASKNDPEFIALKNQIDTLMKDSQVLAGLINENQKELSTWQNDNNTENFKVVGAFANVILNTNPNLKEITGDGGDGEDPNKPDLPETDMEFEQTASLNLIGDNALDEDEETEEVDETSLMQKGKICIVSDNFKTMNPCIVGGL
ncbi:filamentous hemagglutinin N-terminal domain-containing protein [Campylobacter lari]|uniref:filamentous hemagglutinin N-terminal domain-containing protein n=1 Tax=Campylobacter lari TaxID=201 RepID=UPI0021535FBC|nr:filamentous hemagglutinin N-terminal domain-containing protein [Campylobacter lari]MCR6518143.1 filamentous hemagglutinin N-terminal domain-containing protein [Campylobacter lari]